MSGLALSICIATISFIGALVLVFLAYKSAKKDALNKIKNTNQNLSIKSNHPKHSKSLGLAK